MGLSRGGNGTAAKAGPRLIDTLAANGDLKSSVYAVRMESRRSRNHEKINYIDLGGAVVEHMADDKEVAWLTLSPSLFWMSNELHGIRFGENEAFNLGS